MAHGAQGYPTFGMQRCWIACKPNKCCHTIMVKLKELKHMALHSQSKSKSCIISFVLMVARKGLANKGGGCAVGQRMEFLFHTFIPSKVLTNHRPSPKVHKSCQNYGETLEYRRRSPFLFQSSRAFLWHLDTIHICNQRR